MSPQNSIIIIKSQIERHASVHRHPYFSQEINCKCQFWPSELINLRIQTKWTKSYQKFRIVLWWKPRNLAKALSVSKIIIIYLIGSINIIVAAPLVYNNFYFSVKKSPHSLKAWYETVIGQFICCPASSYHDTRQFFATVERFLWRIERFWRQLTDY